MTGPGIRIWDLPVRLFHWAIVLLVPAMWATHHYDMMDLHILLGEIFFGLLLFRLVWGLLGSSTARFSGFLKGPGALMRHLRGPGSREIGGRSVGHSPLGGWSVAAMLLVIATQIGLGLFSIDEDALYEGPLSHLVSYDTGRTLADRHETFFWILVGLIALHVLAIFYYLVVRRDNLVTPMVTGRRLADESETAMAPAPLTHFLLSAALAAGMALVVIKLL